MTLTMDPRVDAYLRQLDYALAALPWDQRSEIFSDISSHIEREIAAAPPGSDAVEDVLRRMGDPQEIALEAGATPAPPPRRSRALEIWATALIAAGGFFLPFVGWIVGVVLLWQSRRFRRSDKWIGTLVPPFGFFAPFFVGFVLSFGSARVCTSHGPCTTHATALHAPLFIVLIGVLGAATYTVVRLSRQIARMT